MAIGNYYNTCVKFTPDGNPLPYSQKIVVDIDGNGTDILSSQSVPLAQRHDADTTIAAADGDFAQLQLSDTGRLKVDIGSNVTISGVTVSNEVEVKNDVGNPIPVSAISLPLPTGASTSALQTTGNTTLDNIYNNNISKIDRIKGANNYSRTFTYYLTTDNPTVIVHTGTTALGSETITETITYTNAAGGDFRITNIIYS